MFSCHHFWNIIIGFQSFIYLFEFICNSCPLFLWVRVTIKTRAMKFRFAQHVNIQNKQMKKFLPQTWNGNEKQRRRNVGVRAWKSILQREMPFINYKHQQMAFVCFNLFLADVLTLDGRHITEICPLTFHKDSIAISLKFLFSLSLFINRSICVLMCPFVRKIESPFKMGNVLHSLQSKQKIKNSD